MIRTMMQSVTCMVLAALSFASIEGAVAEEKADKPQAVKAQKAKAGKKKAAGKKRKNPAFAQIQDDPNLPRVLLIGDSISIGYTLPTRKVLQGKVNLHRIPENGGPTTRGLTRLSTWLGKKKWDVIHFNFGLHDLKVMPKTKKAQVSIEDYEKNLEKIVKRLKETKAALIWATTTPVQDAKTSPKAKRTNENVEAYNAVAAKIMKAEGIATDDLYTVATEGPLVEIQRGDGVHFSPKGSKALAKRVAAAITEAIRAGK